MSKIRNIERNPSNINYFLVDACFLANRYIPTDKLPIKEKERIEACKNWWVEISAQQKRKKAIVYIPDVCIAEAFKVLAKKYYREKAFSRGASYNLVKNKFSQEITIPVKTLKAYKRNIGFHDISTCRDLIISVDRFLEVFMKENLDVSIIDLIILATAKYLIDFFRIPRSSLFIVTMDEALHKGSRKLPDIPSAFNPTKSNERADKVFIWRRKEK